MASPKKSMAKAMRIYLSEWPVGESRSGKPSHWDNTPQGSPSGVTPTQLTLAVDQQYLTRTGTQKQWTGSGHTGGFTWTRTEKPCQYKPRGPDPKYAEKNPFPWSNDEHWDRIENSTWRMLTKVTRSLLPKSVDWAATRMQDTKIHRRFPKFIDTKALLTDTRAAMLFLFTGQTRTRYGREHIPMPEPMYYLGHTGAGIRLLLLEMLVEPQFDENHEFVRFVPIDNKAAWEEANQILSETDDGITKYVNYMGGRQWRPQLRLEA